MPRKLLPRAFELAFRATAEVLPKPLLREVFRLSMRGLSVGLCLHRVGERRPQDPYPHTTASVAAVDTFLDLASPRTADPLAPQVVMCFDDGYADAADYVASRAPFYPKIEWMMFVCPEKVEKHAGFRWDLFEVLKGAGRLTQNLGDYLQSDMSVDAENNRPELRDIGARAEFRVATLEALKRLLNLPNVKLGNHTNTHFMLTTVSRDDAQKDFEESTAQFNSMFGPADEFAFPFGLPDMHFDEAHVMALRSLGNPTMWTTQDGVFAPNERRAGVVLPRIVFRGLWSGKAMALWVSYLAVRQKMNTTKRMQPLRAVQQSEPEQAPAAVPHSPAA